jgi:hypothetical protein
MNKLSIILLIFLALSGCNQQPIKLEEKPVLVKVYTPHSAPYSAPCGAGCGMWDRSCEMIGRTSAMVGLQSSPRSYTR